MHSDEVIAEVRKSVVLHVYMRSFERILQYLRETKTETGLRVAAQLVPQVYQKGIEVADEVMATLNITHHTICPK